MHPQGTAQPIALKNKFLALHVSGLSKNNPGDIFSFRRILTHLNDTATISFLVMTNRKIQIIIQSTNQLLADFRLE